MTPILSDQQVQAQSGSVICLKVTQLVSGQVSVHTWTQACWTPMAVSLLHTRPRGVHHSASCLQVCLLQETELPQEPNDHFVQRLARSRPLGSPHIHTHIHSTYKHICCVPDTVPGPGARRTQRLLPYSCWPPFSGRHWQPRAGRILSEILFHPPLQLRKPLRRWLWPAGWRRTCPLQLTSRKRP